MEKKDRDTSTEGGRELGRHWDEGKRKKDTKIWTEQRDLNMESEKDKNIHDKEGR